METKDVIKILDPQFGCWAKSNGELLYAHHFSVWSIFRKLADFVPSLDMEEKELVELACLVHDIGKLRKENQEKLKKNKEMVEHRLESDEIKEYFNKVDLLKAKDSKEIEKIRDIVHPHHGVAEHDLREIFTPGASFFTNLLRTADHLASMEGLSFDTILRLREFYKDKIDFTYFSFSRFASPTTFLVMDILIQAYKEQGWVLLLAFENGAVFASKPQTPLPEKPGCVKKINEEIIKKSLSLQKPFPTNYTGDFLALLSKAYPHMFLECNKDKILEALGNKDQKPLVFFKLVRDILSASGLISSAVRGDCWILGLLESANSTSAHRKAKELFIEKTRKPSSAKVNAEMINPLFDKANVGDLFPQGLEFPQGKKILLSTLNPKELFALLESVASLQKNEREESGLEDYISVCVSIDEETDFYKIANESFKRYCSYKRTANAEKGVCERCGCPVSQKMQPALNLSRAPQAFSQIKAKYAYRAICALCALDNLTLREGVRFKQNRVYLRIQTRVPDLLLHHKQIKRLVGLIAAGVRNPRQIVRFKEITDLGGLPFPQRVEIPIAYEESAEKLTKDPILQGDNGALFIIGWDIRQEDFSPKDLRAQYEPLYHIMKYLGFKVALGTEEQDGLFGEDVLTDEEGNNYYLSLAVILLANIIEKKSKKFVFARNLILKSPSSVLMFLVDMYENKNKRKRFSKEQYDLYSMHLLKALKKSNSKIVTYKGGDLDMEGLLKDAAFFADREKGIPQFCAGKDFWKDLSKYKAAKPVSQALDAMMSGLQFDVSIERFMRTVRDNVAPKKLQLLRDFVLQGKTILKKYYEIRQQDVAGFIKAKNSLISAIYILTRYKDLKEVAND